MDNFCLNERVKELRIKKGISQEILAENTGLSLRTIQRVENGDTVPRGDTLKRLAVALQVTLEDIVDWRIIEDKNALYILNVSQIGFLAFPLLGIIIPLIILAYNKSKVRSMEEVGKSILNFQISWVILLAIILILQVVMPYFQFTKQININLIFLYAALYSYNLLLIIINSIRSRKGKKVYYLPAFRFLK